MQPGIFAADGPRDQLGNKSASGFAAFALSSLVFYTEYKNVMTRTAHLKEAMRERQWKVTPRSANVPAAIPEAGAGLILEPEAA